MPERKARCSLVLGACLAMFALGQNRGVRAQDAAQILQASGVNRGLIVHVGCGDGRLTAALRGNEDCVVHGLDADAANISKARAHIQSLGLYGKVSVEHWTGDRLPYADNLVNLLVSAHIGKIPMREVMRVLVPNGVAYVKSGDAWAKSVKPPAEGVDEWTHYLHDASGNPVAHDRVVGPPRRVQWIAKPRHSRSHEYTPSIMALVSARGRIFYVADQAPIAALRSPAEWYLMARDAYNGVLLWKRPMATWFSHLCGWTQGPRQLQRKVVAVGNRVYVTLGFHEPLSALDAATGQVIKVYEQTRGTEEVLCHKGILLLVVREVTDERAAEFAKWAQLEGKKDSPLRERDSRNPLVKSFRSVERKAPSAILALDADTGQVLWKHPGWRRPLSLCATGDRVLYQKGREVVCLDLATGEKRWSVRSSRMRVVCDSCVVCSGGKTVTALSAENGEKLWTQEALLCNIRDAFVINGSLWLGGFKPYSTGSKKYTGPVWGPYFATQRDLATGKVLKHIESECPRHHHRCWQNKATDRYILAGRRGVEFYDLDSGEVLWHSWVRGVCRYGVMPCNGLLYAPPHACACYVAAKLTGFYALAADAQKPGVTGQKSELGPRLERGPAFSQIENRESKIKNANDWPTYRHDPARSGFTKAPVPTHLKRIWQADLGGKLSSLTVAEGKVFVALMDEHRVSAMDADSGEPIWSFTAGGRVDSPPTLYEGRAIFGSCDGYAYSLRASDGALAWRLRAARDERRITAWGQLESVSPVHGSVLVHQGPQPGRGVAYVTAGRSSYLDAGIDLCRLEPETGKVLSTTPIYSPDPDTGRQPKQYGPCYMPGALWDILTSDDQYVYLRDLVFDRQGVSQPKGSPHLLTMTGFLDDTWPHRSYWVFGTRCSIACGCSGRDRKLVYGRLLVFDDSMVYGYGRAKVDWSNQLLDAAYRLFAVKRGEAKARWTAAVPIQVKAMVLADKVLFAAGPAKRAGDRSALLLALSAADGRELARHPLDSPPVLDGMAAANGRLYLACENGRVLCMGKE